MSFDIVRAVETYKQVTGFVTGGDLAQMLTQSGDVHFEAAHRELALLNDAVDKNACVNRAAVALQVTRVFYEKAAPTSVHGLALNPDRASKIDCKHNLATAALAMCYLYLKEKQSVLSLLSDKVVETTEGSFFDAWRFWNGMSLMILNPLTYLAMYKHSNDLYPGLNNETFSSFKKAAVSLAQVL